MITVLKSIKVNRFTHNPERFMISYHSAIASQPFHVGLIRVESQFITFPPEVKNLVSYTIGPH
jgi:hypothetical protein